MADTQLKSRAEFDKWANQHSPYELTKPSMIWLAWQAAWQVSIDSIANTRTPHQDEGVGVCEQSN